MEYMELKERMGLLVSHRHLCDLPRLFSEIDELSIYSESQICSSPYILCKSS